MKYIKLAKTLKQQKSDKNLASCEQVDYLQKVGDLMK